MKVAVIGSRGLTVINDLGKFLPEGTTEIVSGGARGIDTCAKEYALAHGLKLTEFLPEYDLYGRAAEAQRYHNLICGYFQTESDRDRLMQKIEHCYQRCRRKWSQMTPEQILDEIDEIHAASVVYRVLTRRGVSEDDASWLARFRNPLAVVSDAWQYANDLDSVICESRIDGLITDIRDRGDAEEDYAMDDDGA